jgi:TolA-binding protein
LSPTSPEEQAAPVLTPAQQAIEQGRQAFESGEYTRALDAFRSATNTDPRLAEAHHWLGKTHMAMNNHAQAAESFLTAATYNGQAEDYLRAAAAFHAAGAKEKAAEALAASLKAKQ